MADRYLLESGAPDGYQLEDGTGVLLNEVDSTPPVGGTRLRGIVWPAILLAWQVAAEYPNPQAYRQHPIATLVTPADDPPFGQRPVNLATIQRAWPQHNYGRPAASSGEGEELVADTPPPGPRSSLSSILRLWQPAAPPMQRARTVPVATPADDPPRGGRRWLQGIVSAWHAPRPPIPLWSAVVGQDAEPDNPPWNAERHADLSRIVSAWQPVPTPPQALRHVVPTQPTADDPPWHRADPSPIVRQWEPEASAPTLRRPLAQPYIETPQDPPFGQRAWLPTILRAWEWRRIGSSSGAAAEAPPEVNDPPFGARPNLGPIVAVWHLQPPLPTRPRHLVQPGVAPTADDPPFGAGRRWVQLVAARWSIRTPLPLWAPALGQPTEFVPSDPPFGVRQYWSTIAAWQPKAPRPWQATYLDQPFIPDAPPVGLRAPLSPILLAWQPGPWGAQRARTLPVSITAVPVDDPPFGLRTPLWPILRAWQPGPSKPWVPEYVVQDGVAIADPPPFTGAPDWLWGVLRAWQPGPWGAQWARILTESGPAGAAGETIYIFTPGRDTRILTPAAVVTIFTPLSQGIVTPGATPNIFTPVGFLTILTPKGP